VSPMVGPTVWIAPAGRWPAMCVSRISGDLS
jgi:hypothetical protein